MYPCRLEWPGPRYRKEMSLKSCLALMLPKPWVFTAGVVEGLCLCLRSPLRKCRNTHRTSPARLAVQTGKRGNLWAFQKKHWGRNWRRQQQGWSLFWNRMSVKDTFCLDLLDEETSETAEGPRVGKGNMTSPFLLSTQYTNSKTICLLKEKIFPRWRGSLKSVSGWISY